MTSPTSNEPTMNEIYERVRNLLEAYYNCSGPKQGGIELALEQYSLNGREIVRLIEDTSESILEDNLGDWRRLNTKLKDLINATADRIVESQKERS